jgi:hypothetical protein
MPIEVVAPIRTRFKSTIKLASNLDLSRFDILREVKSVNETLRSNSEQKKQRILINKSIYLGKEHLHCSMSDLKSR